MKNSWNFFSNDYPERYNFATFTFVNSIFICPCRGSVHAKAFWFNVSKDFIQTKFLQKIYRGLSKPPNEGVTNTKTHPCTFFQLNMVVQNTVTKCYFLNEQILLQRASSQFHFNEITDLGGLERVPTIKFLVKYSGW